ncbi:MAG: hypothetical protein HRT37_00910 [Alteromonadaceae bacterium]|nr:hypothetical protein [Alteromonadaceae bacterium]
MNIKHLKRFNTLLEKLLDNSINQSELAEYQKLCRQLLVGIHSIAFEKAECMT